MTAVPQWVRADIRKWVADEIRARLAMSSPEFSSEQIQEHWRKCCEEIADEIIA